MNKIQNTILLSQFNIPLQRRHTLRNNAQTQQILHLVTRHGFYNFFIWICSGPRFHCKSAVILRIGYSQKHFRYLKLPPSSFLLSIHSSLYFYLLLSPSKWFKPSFSPWFYLLSPPSFNPMDVKKNVTHPTFLPNNLCDLRHLTFPQIPPKYFLSSESRLFLVPFIL